MPAPTGYVNDLAGVLSPEAKQSLEALCTEVDQKALAQIAVVTVQKLEADPVKGQKAGDELPAPSIEEFAVKLEEKWKVGAKGTDRGILVILSLNPRKYRIEVGYGLEGTLPDGKVGDIGREMVPYLHVGDYSQALTLGVHEIAQDIASDANVTLSASSEQAVPHTYREIPAQPQVSPIATLIFAVIVIGVIATLIRTGHIGLLFFLLFNLLGAGGGGNDDERGGGFGGGGFGGFGGGGSGGGGASGDF